MAGQTSSATASAPQQSTSMLLGSSKNPSAAQSSTPPSSSPVAPPTLESYFSKSQMSIALALVKAIPESLSTHGTSPNGRMAEYLLELRKRIVQNNPNKQNESLRYVDTCEFWRELCERVHRDNKELQGKVRVLEERQRIFDRMSRPDLGDRGERSSRKRPASLDEVEDWFNDEGTDPSLPICHEYLRFSSYSKSWLLAAELLSLTFSQPSESDETVANLNESPKTRASLSISTLF